jgi:thiol-disulfide isomerase/thioredoxin
MKPILTLLLAILILGRSQAQKDFIVRGDIEGVEDGVKVTLFQIDGNVGTQVAADTVVNGHFTLRYKGLEQVEDFTVNCYGSEGFPPFSLQLFARSGSVINVKGKNKWLKTWTVQSDVPEQKEYDRFLARNRAAWDELQQLYVRRALLKRNIHKVTPEESDKIIKSCDSLDARSDIIDRQIKWQEIKMLQRSTASDITMRYLKDAAHFAKLDEDSTFRQPVGALYAGLSPQQQHSRLGEEIYSSLYPPMIVQKGAPMADADFADRQGNSHRLADYRGKYLLLDFWSVGCGPCRMAVPELKELSLTYRQQLEVIGVSLDTKKTWIDQDDKEMIWPNLSDGKESRGIAAKYGVSGMPHYSLISPDGILLDSWEGYDKGHLIARIKEYIKD